MLFFEQPAHGPQGLHSSQRRDFCCLTHVVAWSHAHTTGCHPSAALECLVCAKPFESFQFHDRRPQRTAKDWQRVEKVDNARKKWKNWELGLSWRIGHQSRPKKDKNSHDSLYVRVFQPQFLYCDCNRVQFKRAIQNRYCTGTTAWWARGPFFLFRFSEGIAQFINLFHVLITKAMYWLCISSGIALTNMYTVASLSKKYLKVGLGGGAVCNIEAMKSGTWWRSRRRTQQVDPMKTGDCMQVLNSSVARSFSACVAGAVSCAIRYGDVVLSKRGCSVLSMNCQKAASLWWCARRKQFFLNGTFESF